MSTYKVTMPQDEEKKTYPLFPEGEAKFQVVDFKEFPEKYQISLRCESIDGVGIGKSIFYNVSLAGDFLWLTKLFLKCVGEPHNGELELDPTLWIGRQFYGEVKHSSDGKYANIKKLIYKDIKQPVRQVANSEGIINPEDIAWEE